MKERNFEKIDFSWNSIKPLSDKAVLKKDVYGWDSETFKGKVSLMGVYGKEGHGYLIPDNCSQLLKFMSERKFNSGHNFFFNLKYDRDAVIKWLPDSNINELKENDNTFYKNFKITLIGNKALIISRWGIKYYQEVKGKLKPCQKTDPKAIPKMYNNHSSFFSDISSFYQCGTLSNTVTVGLNQEYIKGINIEAGVRFTEDKAFIQKKAGGEYEIEPKTVIDYCIDDCKYTYLLGQNVIDLSYDINIPVKRFYSPASISKSFMRKQLTKEYKFIPNAIQQYAFNSFNAGRFEILKRGYWGDKDIFNLKGKKILKENNNAVYMCDINSAYPEQIKDLYKPEGITIKNRCYEPEALYSYFLCNIKINNDFILSPFKYCIPSLNHLLTFPTGIFNEVYLSKTELEILDKMDCRYTIKKAIHIFNSDPELWLLGIEDIYNKRLELKKLEKKTGEPQRLQHLYKLILNSLYGCCIQENRVKELTTVFNKSDLDDVNTALEIIDLEGEKIINLINTRWKAGGWFNPILASEITARTRNKIFNDFYKYEDKIIMIATDSITMTDKIPFKDSDKLGGYEVYKPMQGIVIGNGVYKFSVKDNPKLIKKGNRGILSDNHIDLFDLCQGCMVDKITLTKTRPKSLRENLPLKIQESIPMGFNPNDYLNIFMPMDRDLNINADSKRKWDRNFINFDEINNGEIIDSIPLNIKNG